MCESPHSLTLVGSYFLTSSQNSFGTQLRNTTKASSSNLLVPHFHCNYDSVIYSSRGCRLEWLKKEEGCSSFEKMLSWNLVFLLFCLASFKTSKNILKYAVYTRAHKFGRTTQQQWRAYTHKVAMWELKRHSESRCYNISSCMFQISWKNRVSFFFRKKRKKDKRHSWISF